MLDILKLLRRYEVEMDIIPLRLGRIEDLVIRFSKDDYHVSYAISKFDLDRMNIDNAGFENVIKSCIEKFVAYVLNEENKE